MTEREALKLALEALEDLNGMAQFFPDELYSDHPDVMKAAQAIKAIKEALAKPEQEEKLPPVEIGVDVTKEGTAVTAFYRRPNSVMEIFYSQFHPAPQRTWVGLTTNDWDEIKKQANYHWEMTTGEYAERVSHLVEEKLKGKNA